MDDNELVDALFAAGRDIGSLPTHVCAEAAERLQEVCNLVRQLRMENAAANEDLNKTRGRLGAAGRSLSNRNFEEAGIVSTYARLYSNAEVKFFDVNKKGQTIREWWTTASDVPFSHKLIEGETVLYSGLTMEERAHA